MEAATIASTVVGVKGPRQFQGLFDVIPFKFNLDEDSIGAEDSSTGDITVAGAALGDFVLFAPTIDAVSLMISGFVQSANTVTIQVQNLETADANTTFAGNPVINGLVLKPKKNVFNWGP
jgi:hypothetical protein